MALQLLRIFLSHTSEVREYPAGVSFVDAAEAAVKRMGCAPVDMAYFTAAASSPAELCRTKLLDCDVYVGVIGFRYGSIVRGRDDISYTEMEFVTAVELGLPCLVFLLDETATVGPRQFLVDDQRGDLQAAFRHRLLEDADITISTVATPDRLEADLVHALSQIESRLPARASRADDRVEWLPDLTVPLVDRPLLVDQLATELRRAEPRAVTAVHGGPGFGKTTLALVAWRRPDVRAAFPDGVLWVDVGQDATEARLAERINGLAARLGDERPGPTDPRQAGMRLGELLSNRRLLLVIDDVWRDDQLTPFLQGGHDCHRLVTTRDRRTVPHTARIVVVDRMDVEQGARLLTTAVHGIDLARAEALADACGRWPLLLRLVAGYLHTRVAAGVSQGLGVGDALTEVEVGLAEMGVVAFDDLGQSRRAVAVAVETSLALLANSARGGVTGDAVARYRELAIFPEDEAVPREVLARLWGQTAGWGGWMVSRFCDLLADLALVESVAAPPCLRLHDVVLQYLREQTGADLSAAHEALLDSYRSRLPTEEGRTAWWALPEDDDYLWRNLAHHLVGAGLRAELASLLQDLRWAAAKTRLVGPAGTEADTELVPDDPTVGALGRLVRQTAHLNRRTDDAATVTATLAAYACGVSELVANAAHLVRQASRPALVPAVPLPDQPDPALRRTLRGHAGAVSALVVGPDGGWLASGGGLGDGRVRVWLPNSDEGPKLTGHPSGVSALLVAPDGGWLASAGRDGAILVCDPESGAATALLAGHVGRVSALAVAPDGSWLASAGGDGTVRVWRPDGGGEPVVLAGHRGWVSALAAAPGGSWLASAGGDGRDGTVRVWRPDGGGEPVVLAGHRGWVSALAVAPDGSWLASAGGDGTVRVWHPDGGGEPVVLAGHRGWVSALAVAPDGSWLASAGGDGTVRVWHPDGTPAAVFTGHEGGATHVCAGPRGGWLASAGADGTVRLWVPTGPTTRGAVLPGHKGGVAALAPSPDGSWLASAGGDGVVRLWDTRPQGSRAAGGSSARSVSALATAPYGAWLAAAGADGAVRLWNPSSGAEQAALRGHVGRVGALAAAPDGSWLASAGSDGTVRIWDPASRTERTTLLSASHEPAGPLGPARVAGVAARVSCLVVAPDGSWLASAGADGVVRVWDPAAGTERAALVGHTGPVAALAVAPDGSWLASASGDGTVRVWDPASGVAVKVLPGQAGAVSVLVAAPDGSWLASGGIDAQVRLWPAHWPDGSSAPLGHGPDDGVVALTVAPDGSWLAAASNDRTIRLWDPSDRQLRAVLRGHTEPVLALAASASGRWLASVGRDQTVRLWRSDDGTLAATLRVDGGLATCLWLPHRSRLAVGGSVGLYLLDLVEPVTP